MLSIHLRLGLPSGLFPSGFPICDFCADINCVVKPEFSEDHNYQRQTVLFVMIPVIYLANSRTVPVYSFSRMRCTARQSLNDRKNFASIFYNNNFVIKRPFYGYRAMKMISRNSHWACLHSEKSRYA
jgi:hypothetical protein